MHCFTLIAQAMASPIPDNHDETKELTLNPINLVPVLPEVGSMTILFPGMSLPSFSAASTIAFAILSFTDPPADMNSTLATARDERQTNKQRKVCVTEVTFDPICVGYFVQADKGSMAYCTKSVVEDICHDCWG